MSRVFALESIEEIASVLCYNCEGTCCVRGIKNVLTGITSGVRLRGTLRSGAEVIAWCSADAAIRRMCPSQALSARHA
jgi:hypothetical protein